MKATLELGSVIVDDLSKQGLTSYLAQATAQAAQTAGNIQLSGINYQLIDQYFAQLNPNFPPGFSQIHPDLQPTQAAVAALGNSAGNFEAALRNYLQLGFKAIADVPSQTGTLWPPRSRSGEARLLRVQGGEDWGSSEFGSAATAGAGITTAGFAIVGLSGNATVAAAVGAGVLVGGGLLIAQESV